MLYLMIVNKREQLHYLERKHRELQKKYFYELTEGSSMDIMKDLSFVLESLSQEIHMLKSDLKAINTINSMQGNRS
jgi:hypothetical protein